jgi:hypothetical protein
MRRRRAPEPTDDPDLRALREADAEYHRLCIDIQEPDVPASQLPIEELVSAVAALSSAVERLRSRT